jgi:hypothetical protein
MDAKCSLKSSHTQIQNFQTTLQGETTKMKVVHLVELVNFIVNFSFEIIYPRKTMFEFLKFEI